MSFQKGHKVPDEWREKLRIRALGNKWNLGRRFTEETKKKIGLKSLGRLLGKKHPKWKGEDVSYRTLHRWVERCLGKPDTCEQCGKNRMSGRQIHWANKSHEYKRDLSDWLRLCKKCHSDYDKKSNNMNFICFKCGAQDPLIQEEFQRCSRCETAHKELCAKLDSRPRSTEPKIKEELIPFPEVLGGVKVITYMTRQEAQIMGRQIPQEYLESI